MKKIFILLFLFSFNNLTAQTIILNDCWNKKIEKKERFVKTRDVILDLQRKTLTFQGTDKNDNPYMTQNQVVVEAVSTGFVKVKDLQVTPGGILHKIYTFDIVNAKILSKMDVVKKKELGHSENSIKELQKDLLNCSGLNGKLVQNKKQSLSKPDPKPSIEKQPSSKSDPKSLLKKLLKK